MFVLNCVASNRFAQFTQNSGFHIFCKSFLFYLQIIQNLVLKGMLIAENCRLNFFSYAGVMERFFILIPIHDYAFFVTQT